MSAIFWDLETSDLNFCSQILNYAFVHVDHEFNEVKRLTGKVKLSRTQLPSPMAVYVNRVIVGDHQEDPESESEADVMQKIQVWVADIAERSPVKVPLIGYNSTKFDLNFLRTSMIRCGVSPYWTSAVMTYRDVLHTVQKLATSNEKFREMVMDVSGKPNLKLATITKNLGILIGEQSHESLDDVLLTIELTKKLIADYDIDPRHYSSFEAKDDRSVIYVRSFPSFQENASSEGDFLFEDKVNRMAFLNSNKSYALWVNLDRYEAGEGRNSIFWFNKNTSPFYVNSTSTDSSSLALAEKARKEFFGIDCNNFWGEIKCDIEQHIFAMPIKGIDALNQAIWYKSMTSLKALDSNYAWEILRRYIIAHSKELTTEKTQGWFKNYCNLRYGGEMVVSKMGDKKHKTLKEMREDLEVLPELDDTDTKIKDSLRDFYAKSEVVKLMES